MITDFCISPLLGVTLLPASMGLLWFLGLENKPALFIFFAILFVYIHFCGGI